MIVSNSPRFNEHAQNFSQQSCVDESLPDELIEDQIDEEISQHETPQVFQRQKTKVLEESPVKIVNQIEEIIEVQEPQIKSAMNDTCGS